MTALLERPTEISHPSHVAAEEQCGVFRRIAEPMVNLCLWRRVPNPSATPAIDSILSAEKPLDLDLRAPSADQLAAGISIANASEIVSRSLKHFVDDVVFLAKLFADIAGTRHPRVRLERVEDDGCALFHADTLRLRMLCTYAGPGTQWLENGNARREQLGSRGRTIEEANRAIVVDESRIRSIPNWHVAIFKGRAWSADEDISLIHRSAPVRHRGDYRLRLCIDLPNGCAC
jgi:hypothetical protein